MKFDQETLKHPISTYKPMPENKQPAFSNCKNIENGKTEGNCKVSKNMGSSHICEHLAYFNETKKFMIVALFNAYMWMNVMVDKQPKNCSAF